MARKMVTTWSGCQQAAAVGKAPMAKPETALPRVRDSTSCSVPKCQLEYRRKATKVRAGAAYHAIRVTPKRMRYPEANTGNHHRANQGSKRDRASVASYALCQTAMAIAVKAILASSA